MDKRGQRGIEGGGDQKRRLATKGEPVGARSSDRKHAGALISSSVALRRTSERNSEKEKGAWRL